MATSTLKLTLCAALLVLVLVGTPVDACKRWKDIFNSHYMFKDVLATYTCLGPYRCDGLSAVAIALGLCSNPTQPFCDAQYNSFSMALCAAGSAKRRDSEAAEAEVFGEGDCAKLCASDAEPDFEVRPFAMVTQRKQNPELYPFLPHKLKLLEGAADPLAGRVANAVCRALKSDRPPTNVYYGTAVDTGKLASPPPALYAKCAAQCDGEDKQCSDSAKVFSADNTIVPRMWSGHNDLAAEKSAVPVLVPANFFMQPLDTVLDGIALLVVVNVFQRFNPLTEWEDGAQLFKFNAAYFGDKALCGEHCEELTELRKRLAEGENPILERIDRYKLFAVESFKQCKIAQDTQQIAQDTQQIVPDNQKQLDGQVQLTATLPRLCIEWGAYGTRSLPTTLSTADLKVDGAMANLKRAFEKISFEFSDSAQLVQQVEQQKPQ